MRLRKNILISNYKLYLNYVAKAEQFHHDNDYIRGYNQGMFDAYGRALGYDGDKMYDDIRTEMYRIAEEDKTP